MSGEDSTKTLTPIDPEVLERLTTLWLPQIDRVRKERRTTRWLVTGILVSLLVVALIPVLQGIGTRPFDLTQGSVAFGFAAIAAFVIKWVTKLQACDDVLCQITFFVHLGKLEPLLNAVGGLDCYSSFQGIIDDVKRITT